MLFGNLQTIYRHVPGSYVRGRWIEGTHTEISVVASVQPLADRDVISLPAGKRAEDSVKIYCESPIYAVDEKLQREADRLQWMGNTYECVAVEPWQNGIISHYKAMFSKV